MPAAVPPPAADDRARANAAITAALAAIDGRPVDDDSRPARRAASVIRAIQAHRPTGRSAGEPHGRGGG